MLHRPWRELGDSALHEELVDAKRILEDVVGRPVTEAACPFGSYDRRVLRRAAQRRLPARVHERPRRDPLRSLVADAQHGPVPGRGRHRRPHRGAIHAIRIDAPGQADDQAVAVTAMPATVHPITEHDTARVDAFLREHLNPRVDWEASMRVPWTRRRPERRLHAARRRRPWSAPTSPSTRRARSTGGPRSSATSAAWCVLPEHRFQGLRLLKALLAQDGYHFTDLSPSGNVVPLNRRHGLPGARHPHRSRAQPAVAEPARAAAASARTRRSSSARSPVPTSSSTATTAARTRPVTSC